MNARRRAAALACAVVTISSACGSEGDARDAGVVDAGRADAGRADASTLTDLGTVDAGTVDAGPVDVGTTDVGGRDVGPVDAGAVDAGPLRAVSLAASSAGHACAAMSDGTARCWGLNDNGQLGVAPGDSSDRCRVRGPGETGTLPCEKRPRAVTGLADVRQVATGNGTTCALRGDGSVWCWGLNDSGELGKGTASLTPSPTPARVNLPPARQVALGAFHACALLMDGTVRCWGSNRFAQLGLAVASSPARCNAGLDEPVPCAMTPVAVAGLSGVAQLSLGRHHSCARLADASLRCWGLNDSAQLGLGRIDADSAPQVTPAAVTGADAAEVAAGGSHTCARGADGSLRCWGWGDLGQLGGASTASCDTPSGPVQCAQRPAAVPGLAGVSSVATGRFHTCVALTTGGVRCFGRDDNGQLGGGSASSDSCSFFPDRFACSRTPREVSVTTAAGVSVGDYHSCALTRDGLVRCWGYNAFGQLGDGSTDDQNAPVTARLVP